MGPGKAETTGLHFVHASSASINPYKHTRRPWAHLTRPFFITKLVFSNSLIVISSLTLLLSIDMTVYSSLLQTLHTQTNRLR